MKTKFNKFLMVIVILSFFLLISQDKPIGLRIVSASYSSSLSQSGITWTFSEPVEYGTYANGDYWVAGPVEIINIYPQSTKDIATGRVINGSMLNPALGSTQGYDSEMDNNGYSEELNVARLNDAIVSDENPLSITSGSLVSSITHPEPEHRPQLTDAAVLTVVSTKPAEGSFRPPYSGENKTHYWNKSDIEWNLLPGLDKNNISNLPDIPELEGLIQKVWLDHGGGTHRGRTYHPSNHMEIYGRDMAVITGDVALALMLDYPRDNIEYLLVYFLQLGIDWYGVTNTADDLYGGMGGIWWGGGGHGHGRKWPMLFAGIMMDDNNITAYCDGEEYPIFQEEQQYFYVTQEDVDRDRYTRDGRQRDPYTTDMIGLPEWGAQHLNDPERDGSNWNVYYREIVSASIGGHVLAAHMMNARSLWNWEAIFEYQDRWWVHPETDIHGYSNFLVSMWHEYRDDYPPVWTE